MWTLLRELRIAARILWTSPAFTAVAVGTLALAIAANMTVFGWIDTVLLRPVPGATDPGRLAALEAVAPDGGRLSAVTHPDFRDFQRQLTGASGVVASHVTFFSVGSADHPRRVLGEAASANLFAVLGVRPYLGRVFSPEEDRDDPGAYPIAVISHRLWRTYFGSDRGIVGRSVRINGRQFTVVGVTPPDFRGTFGGVALDVWVPLSMILQVGGLNTWAVSDRNARFLNVTVRMKRGVTIPQLRAEAQAVAARIAAAYPDTHRGVSASVYPLWQATFGLQPTLLNPLRILMAVCMLVLLIACANVANLLMARSVTRQREFGIRMAMGAGRGRLVRQLMLEVLALAVAGAVAGTLLAQWLGESISYVLPALDSPIRAAVDPLLHAGPNTSVLVFALAITLAAALLSAVLPAMSIGRVDVNETLKEGGRSGTAGARSHRARGALVVAEVALAAVAVIGAGLAVRSFQKFATIHPGFDPHNVLVAHLYLSVNGYSLQQEKEFCRNLRMRLENAPGIESVSHAETVPLSIFSPGTERVQVDGSAPDRRGVISLRRSVVAPGYFSLMRIPLVAGRDFTEHDDVKSPRVIVVNQSFATRYFGEEDPIGRRVRVSGVPSTIVGVAKDSKYNSPGERGVPFFYGCFRQVFFSGHNDFLLIRTTGGIAPALAALRREVAALNPGGGLYDAAPLIEYTQAGLFAERVAAGLLSALGFLSLALAAMGLYSVMAYAVNERTHEIGIRMALGAQRSEVLLMVLGRGLGMTAGGLCAGIVAVVVAARVLSSASESRISVDEPLVFAAAAGFLLLVAFLASYGPARRATKVDPMIALRAE